jgi:hypothetical protein
VERANGCTSSEPCPSGHTPPCFPSAASPETGGPEPPHTLCHARPEPATPPSPPHTAGLSQWPARSPIEPAALPIDSLPIDSWSKVLHVDITSQPRVIGQAPARFGTMRGRTTMVPRPSSWPPPPGCCRARAWERKNKHCRQQADNSLHEKLLDCATTAMGFYWTTSLKCLGALRSKTLVRIPYAPDPQIFLATEAKHPWEQRRLSYLRKRSLRTE